MDRLLLITNPAAGLSNAASIQVTLTALRRDADVHLAATSDLDAVLAGRDGRDVVVAGGDGSLHAVVAALHRRGELSGPTLGLIPLGTGNDFARGQLISLDPSRAAEVALHGRTCPVDVLTDDDGHIVINAVHVGVGAQAGKEARPLKRVLGRLGYLVGAFKAGFKAKDDKLRVVADGVVLADGSRRVLQVGVGNGPRVGGGTELLPDADPTDGLVDVLVSFSVQRKDRLRYAVQLHKGTHDERHDVQTKRAATVSIDGAEFWCNADGEVVGPFTSRRWTVEPGALTMRLPTVSQAEPADH